MRNGLVVGGCLVLSILSAGFVSNLTGSPATLFGATPIGVGIYLAVGVGLPQYLLSREHDSSVRLGLAVLALVGATMAVFIGFAIGAPAEEWGIGITAILLVIVIGNVIGSGVRAFRAGYQAES